MLIINDQAAMDHVCAYHPDTQLVGLLRSRAEQLLTDTDGEYDLDELAYFIAIEPNDTVIDIEVAVQQPIITTPLFECVTDHGGWYEATVILSDDGYGLVMLVPDHQGVDATLLALLRDQAVQPQTLS